MGSFTFNFSNLISGLERMERRNLAPLLKLETEALNLEGYAKQKAPWADRTGRARQSLNASVSTIPNGYRITLAHGVDYGLWLELSHEKRYAIVMPAIETQGPKIMRSFENFMSRMWGSLDVKLQSMG